MIVFSSSTAKRLEKQKLDIFVCALKKLFRKLNKIAEVHAKTFGQWILGHTTITKRERIKNDP